MYMISLTIQLQLALHRERICRSVICQVFQTMYMKKIKCHYHSSRRGQEKMNNFIFKLN